jgi:hypothetical protein
MTPLGLQGGGFLIVKRELVPLYIEEPMENITSMTCNKFTL